VIANERTPGLPGTRNSAIAAAGGDYVAICDDDDVWMPDRLSRGVAELERSDECDAATGPIRLLYSHGETDRGFPRNRIRLEDLLRDRIIAAHSSTLLVRREAYARIGLIDEAAPGGYGEDYDWLLRAAADKPLAFLDGPPVALIDRTQSMFADWASLDRGIAYLLERHPEFERDPRGLARLIGRRALCNAALGNRRHALRFVAEALRLDPIERRALLAIPMALGLLSAERVQHLAAQRGRMA
jgi:glycosyltransferase involved in cell wall biosynthesis